ncbi:hypothetical protein K523DRAFT_325515 [Schizophyllum commune Tattone D]|nr:hypothetical protein K523DRAFT_325515 [Schizophyllum commune Tattone D]
MCEVQLYISLTRCRRLVATSLNGGGWLRDSLPTTTDKKVELWYTVCQTYATLLPAM